jgi:hypothetical protein
MPMAGGASLVACSTAPGNERSTTFPAPAEGAIQPCLYGGFVVAGRELLHRLAYG